MLQNLPAAHLSGSDKNRGPKNYGSSMSNLYKAVLVIAFDVVCC